MTLRFKGDTTVILWIAAIGAFVITVGDLAMKVWMLAQAWL